MKSPIPNQGVMSQIEQDTYGDTVPRILIGVVIDSSRTTPAPGAQVTYTINANTYGGIMQFFQVTPANRRAGPAIDVQPCAVGSPCFGLQYGQSVAWWLPEMDAIGDCP